MHLSKKDISELTRAHGAHSILDKIKFKPSILERFYPCTVGHTFTKIEGFNILNNRDEYIVQDFLVETAGTSNGGVDMQEFLQINLNESNRIEYYIAPCDETKRFKVSLPKGIPEGYIGIALGRVNKNSSSSGVYNGSPCIIQFNDIDGQMPNISYNAFFTTETSNNAYEFYISAEFTSSFSFKSISVIGDYFLSRNLQPTTAWYEPTSFSAPFGLQASDSSCYVMFGYDNPENITEDLGQVIKIE